MIKAGVILFFTLMILFVSTLLCAAELNYEFHDDEIKFNLTFAVGYSTVGAIKNDKEVVVTVETRENINFERVDFLEGPLKSVMLKTDGTRNRIIFSFDSEVLEPLVKKDSKSISIDFAIPTVLQNKLSYDGSGPAVPGVGAYVRMISGLLIVFVIIIVAYILMKTFFKHNIVSDIPGTGRFVGKVDLEFRKSIAFYEIGEVIYMLGMTENSISLIDKITDPIDVNILKAGFSRKKDFSSYLKFFRNKNQIKDDIKDSSDLIKEKLSSLRKK